MDDFNRQQVLDDEHLRLLRFGYFVSAGMTAFVALIGLLYVFLGLFMLSSTVQQAGQGAPPAFVGQLIGIFGAVFTLVMVSIGVLQFLAGQRLKQRRSRVFCMVIAALTCLAIPYGTFLGVCTFIVLGRPTVVEAFRAQSN